MIDARLEEKIGFDRIRGKIGNYCQTDYALAKCAEEEFLTEKSAIEYKLKITDEMRLILMFEDEFPLSGYIDAIEFLKPLETPSYSIDLQNLRKLRTLTTTLRKVVGFFDDDKKDIYPLLCDMSRSVFVFPEVQRRIDIILDRYGEVRDNASLELLNIRKSLVACQNSISKRISAILSAAQSEGFIDAEAQVVVRDGKMLIPVSAANKRKIKGFVYDESATGKTVFVQPSEVVEAENRITELKFAETREILRILMEFSDFLRPYIPEVIKSAAYLGDIDFIRAKAQVALDFAAGVPIISQEGSLELRKARHPILESVLKKEGKEIVPLTLTLTPSKSLLLISGPNAGGKSVCLKTTGLLQYMFQWGMLIPTSEVSSLPIFDQILVSIGDDQSLDNDLSTYSSFLKDMQNMLEKARDSKTLVLIDEFGSGTEPTAGGAIAEAILQEFEKRGVFGVITTHYSNLKMYAARPDSGIMNGAMMFDVDHIQPLFKMEMGLPGNSFAFEMARKMGLPESLLKSAEEKAGDNFVDIERNLRKIVRSRKALDEKLQRVKVADRTLENITDKYEKELLDIKRLKKEILDDATRQAQDIIASARKEVENTIRTIKETQAEKEATKQARAELQNFVGSFLGGVAAAPENNGVDKKLQQIEDRRKRREERRKVARTEAEQKAHEEAAKAQAKVDAFRNSPLSVGEKVRYKKGNMVGEVVKIDKKHAVVAIGGFTSKIELSELERISSNEFKGASKVEKPVGRIVVDESIERRKLEFSPELDVRGERLMDALTIVSDFIDDALMLSVSSVRIIHGKGTGVLHDEIQKLLRSNPSVVSVEDEHIQFGGSGVTIVKL